MAIKSGDKVRLAHGRTANVLAVMDKRHRGYAGLLLVDQPKPYTNTQWQYVHPDSVVRVS